MKLKLTLLIVQMDKGVGLLHRDFLTVLVNEDHSLPSKYVSSQTIEDTLISLYEEYSYIDMRWNPPTLKDLRHEKGSTESEAVYYACIPSMSAWNKKGMIVTPEEIELEAFYESVIIHEPRGLYRNR